MNDQKPEAGRRDVRGGEPAGVPSGVQDTLEQIGGGPVDSGSPDVAPVGSPAGQEGGPCVSPGVSPEVVGATAGRVLRMVDRALGRDLFAEALRASGDKDWAASVVAEWAWSPDDLDEVCELVRQSAEMWMVGQYFRPDVALAVTVGVHAAGWLGVKHAIRGRMAESKRIEREKRPQTATPADNGQSKPEDWSL